MERAPRAAPVGHQASLLLPRVDRTDPARLRRLADSRARLSSSRRRAAPRLSTRGHARTRGLERTLERLVGALGVAFGLEQLGQPACGLDEKRTPRLLEEGDRALVQVPRSGVLAVLAEDV